ncbi:MAG: phosphatidate cytidylyltransferase [Rhodomicrobium sp.]
MAKPISSELVLRFNSALVLAAVSVAAAYAGPDIFGGLILFFASLMSWEWCRVVRGRSFDGIFVLQLAAIVCAGVLTLVSHPGIAVGVILVATWVSFLIHERSGLKNDPWWSAAGFYYAGFPAIALIAIRQDPDYGFYAILYLFLVVWSADTGAFFTGRLIGGPKLAPSISPNKTWSGLIGGACAACCAGTLFALWFGRTSVPALAGVSVVLAIISQAGDLGESFVKRVFGVKNSSGLIPGHGGVLDRLDSLVFAAMGAGLIAVLADPSHLGRALLIW